MGKKVFEVAENEQLFAGKVAGDCWKMPKVSIKIDNLYLSPFFIVIKIPNGKKGGVVQVFTVSMSLISISQLTLSVPINPEAKKAIRLSV
mgnify:CR=1 FL=1